MPAGEVMAAAVLAARFLIAWGVEPGFLAMAASKLSDEAGF